MINPPLLHASSQRCTSSIGPSLRILVCAVVVALWGSPRIALSQDNPNDKGDTLLQRIEPLSPEQALNSFDIAEGFRIELVAAEPLVIDPVAFCFDAEQRLIVVEMRGYSERPDDHLGRVRRLSDVNQDGQMDHVETLIEGLSWPTAVECWNGGIVVAVAPDLLFLPRDFQLGDKPQVLATGFGRSNVQGLVNSLRWGVDLRLHGATSSSDADLKTKSDGDSFRLGQRDFSWDPVANNFAAVEGGGQHGMMIDPWGDKYVCSNSDHLQQVLMVTPRSDRAQRFSSSPPLRQSIAIDGPQADVFRASPIEPWRILRTRLRVSGQVPGLVEGGGRAAGYFTGATGVYVYDGDQWPITTHPTALVCDVGSNLVHRKQLTADGLWSRGERIDPQDEFVRSQDIWFRPVQLGTGPDGALYICDMYREVIEHPLSLPPIIKSQLDLNSGNDRGRIWRVVAVDQPIRRDHKPLHSLSTADLIPYLSHANAWQRRTAARLLIERQDAGSIAALRQRALDDKALGSRPEGRLQALMTLARLAGGLDRHTLDEALRDDHPRVRQRAVELAASEPTIFGGLRNDQCQVLSQDNSMHVRFQLAHDAAVLIANPSTRAEVLAAIAQQSPQDIWVRWAVEGSLGFATADFVHAMRDWISSAAVDSRAAWQRVIAVQSLLHPSEQTQKELGRMLADGVEASTLEAIADSLASISPSDAFAVREWANGLTDQRILDQLANDAPDFKTIESQLRILLWADPPRARRLQSDLLGPNFPTAIHFVALQGLTGNDAESIQVVVDHLPSLTPNAQQAAFETLGTRREGQRIIALEVRSGRIAAETLPDDLQRQLREHPDEAFHIPTNGRLTSNEPAVSAALVSNYIEALNGQANPDNGHAVFKKVCISCHRLGEEGRMVGPDLRSLVEKSADQILIAVLDPNREVDPKYRVVQVETVNGKIVSGVVSNETLSSLQMIDSQGNSHEIPRQDIQSLRTQDRSFMPNGLEKEINPAEMRDLIAFLKSQPAGAVP